MSSPETPQDASARRTPADGEDEQDEQEVVALAAVPGDDAVPRISGAEGAEEAEEAEIEAPGARRRTDDDDADAPSAAARELPAADPVSRREPCDCPPPLVRSVETGECELPVAVDDAESDPDAAPAQAQAHPPLLRSLSRPKFKVSAQPPPAAAAQDDLLIAIAQFASQLEAEAERRASMGDRPDADEDAAVTPGSATPAAPRTPGADTDHSDDGGSSKESESEVRTVTGAETSILNVNALNLGKNGVGLGGGGGRVVSLEEAVRLTEHGRFHMLLLLVSGWLVMAAVLETVVVGYLMPVAHELRMTEADKGLLGAASYAGIVLSSHTWGLVADTLGRKRALLWASLLDVLASLASSLSPNFATLTALRFCCGLFTSAPAALSFAYLGEFHTPATRSRSIIWIGAFPSIGLIILPGVAWAVLPQCWYLDMGFVRFGPWRLLLVLCALLSLASAIALALCLPESPKFLASRNPKKALAVLRSMYALNTGRPAEDYPVDALLDNKPVPTVAVVELGGGPGDSKTSPSPSLNVRRTLGVVWQQTAPLFRPPFLLHTVLVCLLQFGNLASANGLQIWLPQIFNTLAEYEELHPDLPATICGSQEGAAAGNGTLQAAVVGLAAGDVLVRAADDAYACRAVNVAVYRNNLVIGAASLLMPLVCGLFVNRVGKRNLLVLCLLVSGAFGVLLSVAASSSLVLGLSSVSVAINSMGIGHISSIVVELFPTHLRAMAVSLHLMAGRTGSIVGNLIFGALLKSHCAFAFYAIGGALLACAALSCFLPAKGKFAS